MPTSGLVVDFSGSFGANPYIDTRYATDLGYFLNVTDFKKLTLKSGALFRTLICEFCVF